MSYPRWGRWRVIITAICRCIWRSCPVRYRRRLLVRPVVKTRRIPLATPVWLACNMYCAGQPASMLDMNRKSMRDGVLC
ncbi:hypothetical protein SODALDRAFT_77727 [Sodiomyces alkalinus F11]|uniref:Uncharacterized protein n=1 Tax=Sodiomyces alkalinus (strain CBS 110278 / VKM F-3762 / F11) TaxID=1314773 RepID=A0A3N2PKQ9_SODAK|nr:hypothetical protein SODALDRAFT_77727 [Sodiomyces alkalinus F11]ROT35107.1 hypothetical protein SODALDRAFT_77727 [Sodiomyces alkalinus F11]